MLSRIQQFAGLLRQIGPASAQVAEVRHTVLGNRNLTSSLDS